MSQSKKVVKIHLKTEYWKRMWVRKKQKANSWNFAVFFTVANYKCVLYLKKWKKFGLVKRQKKYTCQETDRHVPLYLQHSHAPRYKHQLHLLLNESQCISNHLKLDKAQEYNSTKMKNDQTFNSAPSIHYVDTSVSLFKQTNKIPVICALKKKSVGSSLLFHNE